MFSLSASFGVVPFGQAANDATTAPLTSSRLLSAADRACYVAKDRGRNHVHVADLDDPALARQRREIDRLDRLRRAIDNQALFLLYQPMVATSDGSGAPSAYEALLRLRLDEGLVLKAAEFLATAERFGVVVEIDCWVLRHVLECLADSAPGYRDIEMVAINVSGLSLSNPKFLDDAIRLINRHRAQAGRLCLEVTETAAIGNLKKVRGLMDELPRLGCRFALDDFGSGFSSFAYLSSLPVEFVKIDGLFVRDMDQEPIHEAMVRSINDVAHSMGKLTIAEYVENDAVRKRLTEIGVDYLQGYAIGRPGPLPVDAIDPEARAGVGRAD